MKKVVKVALALFGASLVLGMASCSNGSDSPNPLVPPATPTTPATDNTGNGGSQQQVPAGCVSVPAKTFDGTADGAAISGSYVFIANRKLTLPAIYASDHEVTQKEYATYCIYGSAAPSATCGVGDNYPAYHVNWYDAIVYCNLKSKADGLTPCYKLGGSNDTKNWNGIIEGTGTDAGKYCGPASETAAWNGITCDWTANGWRLPTEAEWEMLARGGNLTNTNQTSYSGSDTVDDVAWYPENCGNKTHEVKTKAKNGLGLYDMSGNVCEWCWDWYNTIDSGTAWTGPIGPLNGIMRVSCGGDWYNDGGECSVAHRFDNGPEFRYYGYQGFRVVRNAQ